MISRPALVTAARCLVCSLFAILLVASAPVILSSSLQSAVEADDVPAILVSRQLRESLGLSIGDVVSLSSDPAGARPRRFRIAGEYEPVPDPMRLGAVNNEIRLHLPDLIEMTSNAADPLAQESVDAINVGLGERSGPPEYAGRSAAPAPETALGFARDLSSRIPGLVVRSTAGDQGRAAPFIVLERFHLAIAIVTVIASSIFLLALMMMLVDERRETIGILRLIGFRRRRILLHVLAEGVVVALAGAVFGILLCVAFQGGINRFFQWRYDTALVFVRITPLIALKSVALSVPLGVLAVVASSWTLLGRDILRR
jgi:putative ABC transport system permease protein